jgi:hypothetical protein
MRARSWRTNSSLAAFDAALAAYANAEYARSHELFARVADGNPLDRAAAYLRDRSFVMGDAAASGSDLA